MDDRQEIVELIPRLRRYARVLTGGRAESDDLVQDTLERAWTKLHLYRSGTDLRAWLFTVMHNVHVNQVRAARGDESHLSRSGSPLEDDMPELAQGAGEVDTLMVRDLDRAIARLPVEQREVLLLVVLEDFSYDEVARTLGIPIGTVMSRLSRAREAAGDDARTVGLGKVASGEMTDKPPISESELQAHVDGRLAPPRRAEVDDWLAGRPEEAERVAAYRAQSDELRAFQAQMLEGPVPARLKRAGARRPRLRAMAVAAGWIALGVAIGALGGWQLHELRPVPSKQAESTPIARRAALAHATYSPEVRHPVEVGADQEAHLVAWLSKRLGASVRAPYLEALGYSLVGGRLLPGDAARTGAKLSPVAQFMYQCKHGTRITLYMRAEQPDRGETAFRYAQENNVRVFYWIDRSLGYALSSSDVDKETLLTVANSVYQQLNPP